MKIENDGYCIAMRVDDCLFPCSLKELITGEFEASNIDDGYYMAVFDSFELAEDTMIKLVKAKSKNSPAVYADLKIIKSSFFSFEFYNELYCKVSKTL